MSISPKDIFDAITKHRFLLIVVTLVTTVLGTGYAILKKDKWQASQGILVRDEMVLDTGRLGRFESTDAMQTAQETIAEIIYQSDVAHTTLEQFNAREHKEKRGWFSNKIAKVTGQGIDDLKSSIEVVAPNGAPFGRTEMIYFHVKASSPEKALLLNELHLQNVIARLKEIRKAKYASVVHELERTQAIARHDLDQLVAKTSNLEVSFGSDIIELRDLTDSSAGDGHLARLLTELKSERRRLGDSHQSQLKLKRMLNASMSPQDLLALPSGLLQSQPSLSRLRDGLVDAQLRKTELLGLLNADHPKAKAAITAEKQLKLQVQEELKIAFRRLDMEISEGSKRIQMISQKINDVEQRIGGVAKARTPYSSLVSDLENKSAFVDQIERDLTEARANLRSADAVSLVSLVGKPVGSHKPVGPSKKDIVFASMFGGLMIGLGWIFVVEPFGQSTTGIGRRFSDQFGIGRRSSDQIMNARVTSQVETDRSPGRRMTDQQRAISNSMPFGRRTSDLVCDQAATHQEAEIRKEEARKDQVGQITAEDVDDSTQVALSQRSS